MSNLYLHLNLRGTLPSFAALTAITAALAEHLPGLAIDHVSINNDNGFMGSTGGSVADSLRDTDGLVGAAPTPAATGDAAPPATEVKTRKTRAKKDDPPAAGGDPAPGGAEAAAATPGAITGPLKAEATLYFHHPERRVLYMVQPGEPIIAMPGAHPVTEDAYTALKVEYSALTDKIIAEGNAKAAAAASPGAAVAETSSSTGGAGAAGSPGDEQPAPVPTVEECKAASARCVAAGMRAGVVALVMSYGVKSVSDIPEDKRADFVRGCGVLSPEPEVTLD